MRLMLKGTDYYPDGPSERELHELRQSYRSHNIPGLFISDKEYADFAVLLKAMEEEQTEEAQKATEGIDNGAVTDVVAASPEENVDEVEATPAAEENTDTTEKKGGALFTRERLYCLVELAKVNSLKQEANRDSGKQHALTKQFERMQKQGGYRRLAELPEEWESGLIRLEEKYPNFSAVISLIRTESQLASLAHPTTIHLPPILLCGAPGIGKTAFVMDLADWMEVNFFTHSMETSQNGSGLCGSSTYWSNTQTGLVFNALVDNNCINPLFLVDELDKASTDSRHDPIAPLYRLLEENQASQFRDESIPELAINASHINWIFTANDRSRIPAPIFNRLQVFDVPPPTIDQGKEIVKNMFNDFIDLMKLTISDQDARNRLQDMVIKDDAVAMLAAMSVRQAKLKLRTAIAKVMVNRSRALCMRDLVEPIDLSAITVVAGEAGAH